MRRFLFVVALFAAAGARADSLEVLGWTPDGNTVAVLEHGVAEGSGFPWARVTFQDVAKGKPLAAPVNVELRQDGATEEAAVAQAKKQADAARTRLKLAALVPGKEIAHEENGDLRESSGAPIGTVEVKSRKAGKKEGAAACDDPFQPLLLNVVMHWMDDDKPYRILSEKKVPATRACTTGCELGKVFAQAKGALFVLQCGAQGTEGAATRPFLVTAKLPYGLDEELPAQ